MRVFVINPNLEPLSPCHPAKARKLLSCGKAAVWKRYPFTIIMKQEVKNPVVKENRLKIDPGSQVTGGAILEGNRVVFAAELTHRGLAIKANLESRRAIRRGRRNRHTRYRKPRFNRKRPIGWLAPSLQHRVDTTLTWVNRLRKLAPISCISMELVRFDTQRLGGMTKFNRTRLGLPKTHWLDAASVGQSTPENLITRNINPLVIKATGHGRRQMAQINKFGFPRRKKDGSHSVRKSTKEFHGFKTGDIVRFKSPHREKSRNAYWASDSESWSSL